jgi:proton-translocating NADH-quinone oxidoreductase chain M
MTGIILYQNELKYYMTLLVSIIIPITLLTSKSKILQENIFIMNIILMIAFITDNILIWYISFELTLIPMVFIISKGSSALYSRYRALYRFVIYTIISGFCLLITIILLVMHTGSLNYYYYIYTNSLSSYFQIIIFPINLVSYLIKLPIIPFHIWLPDTHGEAPTSGSVILAALLLKLGGVGILHWLIPIFPYAYFYYRPLIFLIGVLSAIYASITTLRHIDIKKLIAYSSISHMGLILIGLVSLSEISYKGIIYLLFSHGLVSAALFLLIGSLYVRTNTRIMVYYRGLASNMPIFSTILLITLLLNASFPPSLSFWSEVHILNGSIMYEYIGVIGSLLGLYLSGVYSIMLFCRISYSYLPLYKLNDLTLREFILITPLLILSLAIIFII